MANETLHELLKQAHQQFPQLSIETQMVRPEDEEEVWAGATVRVTTPKGIYSAWDIGDSIYDFPALEETVIITALERAGVFIPQVPLQAQTTSTPVLTQAELNPPISAFQTLINVKEVSAETAPLLCEDCQGEITDYEAGSTFMSAQDIADKTKDKYGRSVCALCSVKATRKRSRKSPGA